MHTRIPVLLLLLILVITACSGSEPVADGGDAPPLTTEHLPAPPEGMQWALNDTLSDEFNGEYLDRDKWTPYHPYWDGREPSHFLVSNVSLGGGHALLKSTPRVVSMDEVRDIKKDVWVNSACIASNKPVAQYGYYETRMKASKLSMTSSFWLQGVYSEIDVVEQLGASKVNPHKNSWMQMNTHYYVGGWDNDVATPAHWQMPSGSADEFHTYGVWWKDERTVWFYHNNEKVAELTPAGLFEEPMYIFFDTEVFRWEGMPSLTNLNDDTRNTMQVDWVRSWTLAPAS
ncbi:MAG: family 16 glycosylhydrolase [Bacteroidota bacterium]